MPREIWRPFEERFAVRVLEWYGSPEGAFAYNPVGVGPVGSFGRPPAGLLEMDVLGGDGEALPAGRVGELASAAGTAGSAPDTGSAGTPTAG